MTKDITEGNIWKTILKLSWPTQVAFVLHAGFNLVDTFYIGKLGPEAIAALTMAFPIFIFMFSLAGGIGVGTTSLVARYLGAKEKNKAHSSAESSIILSLISTVIFTTFGLIIMRPLFTWMGGSPQVVELAISYATIILIGSIAFFLFVAANSIIRGEGDMKTPMKFMILSTIVNIILDPFLIFGIGPFPELGVQGAALATIISIVFGGTFAIAYLFREKDEVRINLKKLGFNIDNVKKILYVGIPSSIAELFMAFGIIFITKITALFGDTAIASYGIGYRLDLLAILPALGITIAMITIVGHNFGAKKYDRAVNTIIKGSILISIQMGVLGLLFFSFPEFFISLFTNDATVISQGAGYLSTICLTYALIGIGMVVGASFQGTGSSFPLLAIVFTRIFIFPVSIAYAYIHFIKFDISGVWIAIAISNVLAGLVAITWFLNSKLYKNSLSYPENS
ncbi:MATE family efflux transporter [Nanoarchaeota archaeon]